MDRPAPPDVAAALLTAGYRVGGPVGLGADGPAWSAVSLDAGARRVVVRVVDLTLDPRHAARLHRLRGIGHEHLVRLADVLELPDGRCALLTEHVPGATLAALQDARGPWSPGEAVTLAIPLADALAALHAAGLVHSDVSPANVVVRDDGRPVLVDLVSCVVGSSGTPGYAAPEVERGRDCEPAGDVHALARTVLRHLAVPVAGSEEPWAAGARVRDLLAAAADPEAAARPAALALADACFRAEEPEPVVLPDAAVLARTELSRLAGRGSRDATVSRGARRRASRSGRRRRGHRTSAAAALATAALVGLVVLVVPGPWGPAGGAWAGPAAAGDEPGAAVSTGTAPTGAAPTGAASTGAASTGAASTVAAPAGTAPAGTAAPLGDRAVIESAARALSVLRAQVLALGDPAALDQVEVVGSPAHTADTRLLAQLTEEGVRLVGLGVTVTETRLVEQAGPSGEDEHETRGTGEAAGVAGASGAQDEALVRVTSSTSAHQRIRPDGSVQTEVPATASRTVVLVLQMTTAGWRVEDVREPEVSGG